MNFLVDFGCAPQMIFWKLMKQLLLVLGPSLQRQKVSGNKANTSYTQCKQRLTHDTGQPHPIAAKQIVFKIFLDPHLTKCRWGTPILGIWTLWRPKICMMIVGKRFYGCRWRTTLRQLIIINQCSPPHVNNNNKQSIIRQTTYIVLYAWTTWT